MVRILAEAEGAVVPLSVDPYADEAALQQLLADYPELVLAGRADDERPAIWTIGLEVGVPSGSIDVLMLDATGRIWVVETKLKKNPEVRKHVVGQVLAYTSDVASWSRDDLESAATRYLDGDSLAAHIDGRLEPGVGEEVIDRAIQRLAKGDLTALIVVDDLNSVLRRLVEFVNQHAAFGLLAMQMQVVSHEGKRLFFPTVVGEVAQRKGSATKGDDLLYDDLINLAPPEVRQLEQLLDDLASEKGWAIRQSPKSRGYALDSGGFLFRLYPQWSMLEFYLQRFSNRPDIGAPIKDALDATAGRELADKHPALGSHEIVPVWDETVERVLLPYARAVEEIRSTQ